MNSTHTPPSSLISAGIADAELGTSPLATTASDSQGLETLMTALAKLRPIGFSVNLAKIAGDVKAGLLLSQLLYWTRVGVNIEANSGWIVKSREQWSLETGLSRFEQESARNALIEAGLIEEIRVGTPPRLAYRVVLQAVSHALAELLRAEPVQWSLFDVRNDAQQVRTLLGRSLAFYRQFTHVAESVSGAVFLSRAVSIQRNLAAAQTERRLKKGISHLEAHEIDWFAVNTTQWARETGLTPAQTRFSKQKLCQLNLIEQAFQEYPQRKLFIRLKTNRILDVLLRRTSEEQVERSNRALYPEEDSRTKRPTVLPSHSWTNCPVDGAASKAAGSDKTSNCVTVTQLDVLSNKSASSYPKFAKLDKSDLGEFSQTNQGVIEREMSKVAVPEVTFIKPIGEFSHSHRRVFSSLHAGAGFLTTEKTTTPTTKEVAIEKDLIKVSGEFYQADESNGGVGGFSQSIDSEKDGAASAAESSHQKPSALIKAVSALSDEDDVPLFTDGISVSRLLYPPHIKAELEDDLTYILLDHLTRHTMEFKRAQLIMDELAAMVAMNKVKSIPAYFATLLRKDAAGELQIVHAYEWRRKEDGIQSGTSASESLNGATTGTSLPVRAATPTSQADEHMSPQTRDFWDACLGHLVRSFPEQSVQVWLKPLSVRLDTAARTLHIRAQSRFKLDHIKEAFGTKLQAVVAELAPEVFGVSLTCCFVTSFPEVSRALPSTMTAATAPVDGPAVSQLSINSTTRNTGHGHQENS